WALLGETPIDIDRILRRLDHVIRIGERELCQRMARLQIERELDIGQRELGTPALRQRGTDAVKRLRGAGLRRLDQRRQLVASLQAPKSFLHQRMARELPVEGLIDGNGLVLVAAVRKPVRISLREAQHRIVELDATREAHARFLVLARQFENETGMKILEDRI